METDDNKRVNYIEGLDLAKGKDFSVVSRFDIKGHLIEHKTL